MVGKNHREQIMTYRTMPSSGDRLSLIGYGCMRFRRNGVGIDEAVAEKQILLAIEHGVNYFDTAYLYPGNEKVLGKILSNGLRDSVYIATKLPHQMVVNREEMERIFQKQLERLQTDYIDYYLIHNVSSFADWEKLKERGILDFIQEKKARGSICHIGFSYHGNYRDFKKMLDDFAWEFCQIQYNYLDEFNQAGRAGLEYAAEKGVGIVLMEPLRGGLLGAKMPAEMLTGFDGMGDTTTPATLALRFAWEHPGVQVVLSGMNEEAHIIDNCAAARQYGNVSLAEQELSVIAAVKEQFHMKLKVACTGCAYCMPCPHGVDIPTCFSWYNNYSIRRRTSPLAHYFLATEGATNGKPSRASLCRDCGVCEKRCPQGIEIRKQLKDVANVMEKSPFRIPLWLFGKLWKATRKDRT